MTQAEGRLRRCILWQGDGFYSAARYGDPPDAIMGYEYVGNRLSVAIAEAKRLKLSYPKRVDVTTLSRFDQVVIRSDDSPTGGVVLSGEAIARTAGGPMPPSNMEVDG